MEPLDAAEKIRKDYGIQGSGVGDQGSGVGKQVSGVGKQPSPAPTTPPDTRPPTSDTQSPIPDTRSLTPDPADNLFAGIGKSVIQGMTAFPRTFWGALATAEDVVKNVPEALPWAIVTQLAPEEFFKRRYEDVKGIEERFQAKGEGYKKYVNGAIRTMSEMLSQYIGTAGMGTLPSMAAGAGIDKYLGARKEGYSIPRSFAAGGVTATTEFVTEKTPLEILGRPGLKFVDRLMKGLIADIPGEVEATLVEMSTVDTAILGKSYTPQEYLGALLDTAATAALTTVGATGVTHPFVVGTRSPVSSPDQSRVGTAHQSPGEQTPQTPEIKQPAKEEVPGVKPEEYATANVSGRSFLKTRKGAFDFGSIDENVSKVINKPAAPIRLEPGNDEYGKVHIEKKRIEKLKKAGYESVESFVEDVASNYTKIWEQPNGRLMLVKENGDAKLSIIELQEHAEGNYYGVSTAFIAEKNYPQKGGRKLLWERSVPLSASPEQLAPLTNVTPKDTQVGDAWRSGQSNSPVDTIQQGQESVKPEITLIPPLQNLVDNSRLSLEDALEINDIATQNNWSEDTVKKFYKNAVEGLGIQNKDTASLEQMLITAKVKEAVYKQNVEQYKQEIEVNEKLIKTLYDRLNIKIEGGAPDKYETIANDFIKNLGDLKNLKPEEIVQKAQEELALNLNRLDTGMDIKTLIAATVQTINEAEGISKETVSHEQTIQEAMKELPGIYRKVLDMKRGKTLTRQQQLAARILGTALYENFNKTRLLGMADPKNTELSQKAMTQLIELGQYWSKVLASSSEMGRELEAQKIIAKVGEDIPATEEFKKVLDILQGQNEISPEQFYQLTGALRTPDQLAEMAREMAKPVTRRIQDIFLEAWINGLLSNPQTHATNILSNLYTTFASIPERYLASKTHYGDQSGVVDGEAKAMLFGMQMGFRDAVNAARIAWATEAGRFGKTAQKVENAQQKAISAENINRILVKFGVDPMSQTLSNAVDYVGKIWRLPTRTLMTADEFFKMINYRMELNALAYRQAAMEGLTGDKAGAKIAELIQKPTVEMRARAIAHANVQTFTGEMGPVATAISGLTERVPIAKIIVPFVRTPSNIFTYAFDRTPFLAYARSQIRADIKAGGAARDMALGKMAFGGMIAGLAATLAASGFITGSGPEDRDLKKMMRDNGWQPNSIRIGNTYYS